MYAFRLISKLARFRFSCGNVCEWSRVLAHIFCIPGISSIGGGFLPSNLLPLPIDFSVRIRPTQVNTCLGMVCMSMAVCVLTYIAHLSRMVSRGRYMYKHRATIGNDRMLLCFFILEREGLNLACHFKAFVSVSSTSLML